MCFLDYRADKQKVHQTADDDDQWQGDLHPRQQETYAKRRSGNDFSAPDKFCNPQILSGSDDRIGQPRIGES